jgi:hypothetical protein
MANKYNWGGGNGFWGAYQNWTRNPSSLTTYPGQNTAITTDVVTIATVGTSLDPVLVTYDPLAATIGSLTFTGAYDTLEMSGSNNSLTAGYISIAGSNNTLTMSGTNQTVTIGALGIGAATDTLAIGNNTLNITGTGVQNYVYGAITLAGGSLNASTDDLRATPLVSGYGSISFAKIQGGTFIASGGAGKVLDIATPFTNAVVSLLIDSGGGDLKITGAANLTGVGSGSVDLNMGFANSSQTLEIDYNSSLYHEQQLTLNGANILLDGGSALLKVYHGLDLSGGNLSGAGAMQTTDGFWGSGTVTAEYLSDASRTLTFTNTVDRQGAATTFKIGSGATLAFQPDSFGQGGVVGTTTIHPTIDFVTGATAIQTLDLSKLTAASFYGVIEDFYNDETIGSDQILVGGTTSNSLDVTDANGAANANGHYVTVWTGANLTGRIVETIDFGTNAAASHVGFLNNGTIENPVYNRQVLVTTDVICFMAGTMIRTPDGEVAVETLQRGDLVLTSDGLVQPVSWLGRQTIATRFADPVRTWPIRIKAGALDENVPARDLVLSPDHAVLVDGVLVHAGALVNGTSIVRETAVPDIFTYYHVELDDHALVLAENTPAETFIDNVERMAFDNWAEHEALYPEGKPIEELPHPRAKGRRQVPARTRAALDERATIIGAQGLLAVA